MKRCALGVLLAVIAGCATETIELLGPSGRPPVSVDLGVDTLPGDTLPGDTLPGDTLPGDTLPGDTLPGDTLPGDTLPGDTLPGDTLPPDTAPACVCRVALCRDTVECQTLIAPVSTCDPAQFFCSGAAGSCSKPADCGDPAIWACAISSTSLTACP